MEQGTRVGLGPIDRLVLLGAWLVSCAAVYGLGFYTGNHTQDRMVGEEDRVVRLPVTVAPPPAGQRPKGSDDLSFWKALESTGPRIKPGENLPVRPAPVEETTAVPDDPPAPATGQARASAKGVKGAPKATAKASQKAGPKPGAKPATTATASKRPVSSAPAASTKTASKTPRAAPVKASAPAAAKTAAAAPTTKAAPRATSTATASASRAASPERRPAPVRKAPAAPTREARVAAD